MSKASFLSLIEKCDSDIRAGRANLVRTRIAGVNCAKVPREFRLPLARICRRAGMFSMGLRLLAKNVFPNRLARQQASQEELAEYGVLLLRFGAIKEALEVLESVDRHKVPEALLFRAFAHFVHWEYAAAVPLLMSYEKNAPTPYAAAVGRANLGMALTELREHDKAVAVLDTNIEYLVKENQTQLLSNCYALKARVYFQMGELSQSRLELQKARQVSAAEQTNDAFIVSKMSLILEAVETQSVQPLEELRLLALRTHNWETLREVDLLGLKLKFDNAKFLHLIFGTHSASFRERIQNELGKLPDRAVYVLGAKRAPRFDLVTGQIEGQVILSPGSKSHQLVEILLRDFYRPQRVPGLFAELFPGEHFNISSSPDRVYQIIRRARSALKKVPLAIDEHNGFYSLQITGDCSIRIPRERSSVEHMQLHLNDLGRAFSNGQFFSNRDVCEKLDVSRATALRIVNQALESGRIERVGTNHATKYKVAA